MTFFHTHAHSEMSVLDGMGAVPDMVATAADLGQPALALTDHGNVAGNVTLYKAAKSAGIKAFPGSELYVVRGLAHGRHDDGTKWDERNERFHLGVLALDEKGFYLLNRLSSMTHFRDHFHRKPLIPFYELLEWGQEAGPHVAITTGCYFGWVIQHHVHEYGRDVDRTAELVKIIAATFPHTFVELQNHNIDHDGFTDEDICADLLMVADRTGLPVIASQDSHYLDLSEQPSHDMMKHICYRGSSGDSTFPGDGFHLSDQQWIEDRHWPWWDRVTDGLDHLLGLNDLVIPALDTYRFRVPDMGVEEPIVALADAVDAKLDLAELRNVEIHPTHPIRKRLGVGSYAGLVDYELGVIEEQGFASYFLIVADYMGWARGHGITVNARGSANGSLVCYLLGITEVDPVLWDTDFTRFMDPDRIKPPDIDVDVESARREDLLDYIRSRFPKLRQIGTWSSLGTSGNEDEEKGSVFVQWHAAARSRGEDGEIPIEEVALLRQLDSTSVRKSAGAHAGGFVLPPDDVDIDDMLATMLIASSDHTVTQAPMDDVEDAGFVKIDILGLRSLTTLTAALKLIADRPGAPQTLRDIPLDDPKACKVLSSGRADNGVFQFEGFSTARGAKRMRVLTTKDAILSLALFRPAPMNGGQTDRFLEARRTGGREFIHPTVDDLFGDTLGVPIWQEDVLALMKRAGLGVEDRNAVLKAVKMSNDRTVLAQRTFERVHPVFVRSAMETLSIDEAGAERLWATVAEFTDYGFNRAHATGYGLLAYRMAWLKAHYPVEFMTALLDTWVGEDKEMKYVFEADKERIEILAPDVNRSSVGWRIEGDRIRRGIRSIKGIGAEGARAIVEAQPFTSIEDFCERVPGRAVAGTKKYLAKKTAGEFGGALKALKEAGALRSLGVTDE